MDCALCAKGASALPISGGELWTILRWTRLLFKPVMIRHLCSTCPSGTERGSCARSRALRGAFMLSKSRMRFSRYDCPMETLGQAIWESLLLFKRPPGLNLRSRKKTEWPAYRASGASSVRAFEDDYIRISVVGLRGVLRVQADVPAQAPDGLFVGRVISTACQFEAFGETDS